MQIDNFLCFAGSYFCDLDRVVFHALITFSFLLRTCGRNTDFETILCVFKTNCGSHCQSITITSGAPEVIDCSGDGGR